LENGFILVNGTPTDCAHLALTELLPTKPDLVVAGINAGSNLGDDVLYSGTVAAATEGNCFGIPAIAFSLGGKLSSATYAKAAQLARTLVERHLQNPLSKDTILNVNFPCLVTYPNASKFKVARLGQRHKAEKMVRLQDPRGNTVYWIGPPGEHQDAGAGTDFYAIANGEITVTPLQMDLTRYNALTSLEAWTEATHCVV
jgi:5'-nucleotidase